MKTRTKVLIGFGVAWLVNFGTNTVLSFKYDAAFIRESKNRSALVQLYDRETDLEKKIFHYAGLLQDIKVLEASAQSSGQLIATDCVRYEKEKAEKAVVELRPELTDLESSIHRIILNDAELKTLKNGKVSAIYRLCLPFSLLTKKAGWYQ